MCKEFIEKNIRDDYKALTELLLKKKLTITTMESATSGQIASLITDTEGASTIFKGAFITYSNEAKIMQGVSVDIIEKYSVYSREVASEMAVACREKFNADIGIGVTGTMGNVDPENESVSVPGEVYFAIDFKGEVETFFVSLSPRSSRLMYKLAVAKVVYDELTKLIYIKENME